MIESDTSLLDQAAVEAQARRAADEAVAAAQLASTAADEGRDPTRHIIAAHLAAARAHEAAALADSDVASASAEDASNAADPDMDLTNHGRDEIGAPPRSPHAHRLAALQHRAAADLG